jgi:hypothetical protein
MSHRPWESPTGRRAVLESPPPVPLSAPQPLPAAFTFPNAYDFYDPPTLPPLQRTLPPTKRRRSSSPPPRPSVAPPHHPTPPPLGNHRYRFPTASSLSHLVAEISNVVQDLSTSLNNSPEIHPSSPPPPPPAPKVSADEFTTLDSIGHCLETVFVALHALSRSPVRPVSVPTTVPDPATVALQQEKDNLLSSLSRSQKRAETLQKKIISLEDESATWNVEKDRLLGSIEMLEETQQELRDQRNDVRRESSEARGQWTKILKGAGVIERGLWREVAWYKTQREEPEKRRGEDIEGASEMNKLRETNQRLREKVQSLEDLLDRLRTRSNEVQELARRLGGAGETIEDMIQKAAFNRGLIDPL